VLVARADKKCRTCTDTVRRIEPAALRKSTKYCANAGAAVSSVTRVFPLASLRSSPVRAPPMSSSQGVNARRVKWSHAKDNQSEPRRSVARGLHVHPEGRGDLMTRRGFADASEAGHEGLIIAWRW